MIRRLLAFLRDRLGSRPPEPPEPREPDEPDHATLAAVVLVLLSELGPQEAAQRLEPVLARLGVTPVAVSAAADLLVPHVHVPSSLPDTPALQFTARTEASYQAAWLVESARRLTTDFDVERERTYLARHLAAGRARREAAERVDRMAVQFGPMLGWYAIRDSRTTSECRTAHGSNFPAARPPRIGYPGSLHGGACRCVPGPPHGGGRSVDDVLAAVT